MSKRAAKAVVGKLVSPIVLHIQRTSWETLLLLNMRHGGDTCVPVDKHVYVSNGGLSLHRIFGH